MPGEDRRLLLRHFAKDSNVVKIPTSHFGLLAKPAVDELAQQLQTCLKSAEKIKAL
jgi:hypothetical protein